MVDCVHATIAVGGTAEVIDLDDDYDIVEVTNEEQGANVGPMFFTVGSVDDDPPVPTVDGRGTIQVNPGNSRAIRVLAAGATRVRIVCADQEPYSVCGYLKTEYLGSGG